MKMEIKYNDDTTPFVMWGEHKIELENRPITDKKVLDTAERELRETPEVVERALCELRNILKEESELVVPLDSDEFLLKFLRPCKFYATSAAQKMRSFYKFRVSHSAYCRSLVPDEVRAAFHHNIVSILAPRDQRGRRIMLIESGERWNPREVPLAEVFRAVQLGLESAMVEPHTQVAGVVVILDMKGLALTHVMQFTPTFAKMVVDWIQDCTPIRLKAVHIINQPFIFNMVFALFKPFLREKLRARIHFHGAERGALLQAVGGAALRRRHGGDLPDPEISGDVLWRMLHHYESDFERLNSYGYPQKVSKK